MLPITLDALTLTRYPDTVPIEIRAKLLTDR